MADTSEDAYGKVVDRLMDSDEYAERMTSGMARRGALLRYLRVPGRPQPKRLALEGLGHSILPQEQASTTGFVTEQVAGDLIPNATGTRFSPPVSTVCTRKKSKGEACRKNSASMYVTDRVHTFGTAFLGLTLECTRCHDHKYDPVTQKDYFSLSAFFNNIDEAGLYSYFTGSVPTPTLELEFAERREDQASGSKS